MRTRLAILPATILALAALAGGARAADDLRGLDSRASARRALRDAEWLRAASLRGATAPRTLDAGSRDVSDLLDEFLRRDSRVHPAEPQAAATPRR